MSQGRTSRRRLGSLTPETKTGGSLLWQRLRALRRFGILGGQFRSYLEPHRPKLALTIALSVLYAGLRLLEPWPLQILFDQALLGRETRFLGFDLLALLNGDRQLLLVVTALSVLVLAGLSGAVYYAQSLLLAGVGQEMVQELRKDLFHQMQRLSLPFHRRASTGDLLMRLTGDMILLREMILATLVTLTTQLLVLVSVAVLMTFVSWKLTLISIVLAPALYALFRWFRQRMIQAARQQRRREGRLAAAIEEVLLAIPMVKAYTAEAREDERFRKIVKKSARAGLRAARLEAGMQRMVEIVIALGTCLVLVFGTQEVLAGALTPGVFLVFLAYLRSIYRPVRSLSKVAERTSRASAAAERILEVLHAPRDAKDREDSVPAPPLRGEIAFQKVSFTYEDGARALEEVTFAIRPGERVALVGPSGAGKSTLFSLLLRFHRPSTGRVLIDGTNVRRWKLESLRRQIAYLPQEPFILGASVRENLLYGKPDATEEELWSALRAAELEELVRALPLGLETEIRPRGQSLSGGEKQRLAIARAVLKDAPILLLDEPTTGLDARTEHEVLEGLDRLRRGRTTLTIAHRISTLKSADRVLVLDRGKLVEDGTPEELWATGSLFRFLAELQGLGPALHPSPDGFSPSRLDQSARSSSVRTEGKLSTRGAGFGAAEPHRGVNQPTGLVVAEFAVRPTAGPTPGPDNQGAVWPNDGPTVGPAPVSSSERTEETRLVGNLLPDPEVRGVERLRASGGPQRLLRELSRAIGISPSDATLTVVKQRLGQRALLRLSAGASKAGTSNDGAGWHVKLFRGAGGDRRYLTLRRIAEEAQRLDLRVPLPLVWSPRFRALVFESAPGMPVLSCCVPRESNCWRPTPAPGDDAHNRAFDPLPRAQVFERIGSALASLHAALSLPEKSGGREVEAERVARVRDRLQERGSDLRTSFLPVFLRGERAWRDRGSILSLGPSVALHGDFYPAQVIRESMTSGAVRLGILDWDDACSGEAERDVGNFVAHLDLEALRGHLTSADVEDFAARFRAGYESIRTLDSDRLRWYRQGSLLRLAALYSRPEFGPHPPNDPALPDRLLGAL